MKCLIIAAGLGSRLRPKAELKPLAPVEGVALIERVIRTVQLGGADEFYVVSGYRGHVLRPFLDDLAKKFSLPIHHLVNDHWEKPNGWSVLCAEGVIDEPFLLTMSDHIYDPALVSDLIAQGHRDEGLTLAIDSNVGNDMIDLQDVTCVFQEEGVIRQIGKVIKRYNAFDTGVFLCTPDLFSALHRSIDERQDGSLSGGVRVLADEGKAYTHDIGDKFWLDVDDPADYSVAESSILDRLVQTEIIQ
jgi:1L-myo-inositol 1-phosphate cytidylyltransferase